LEYHYETFDVKMSSKLHIFFFFIPLVLELSNFNGLFINDLVVSAIDSKASFCEIATLAIINLAFSLMALIFDLTLKKLTTLMTQNCCHISTVIGKIY